ncbi:MAG: hypothetical protein AAFZ87_04965 [Planctomycetota bacterium]
MRNTTTLLFASLLTASTAAAQTALVREGSPLPGDPTYTVTSIGGVAVNQTGGYVAQVDVDDGNGVLDAIWGTTTPGAGDLLRLEGQVGNFIQNTLETTVALSGTSVVYSAVSDSLITASTGLDGIWIDDTPFIVEEDPFNATQFWSFGSRPRTTQNGTPVFVGGFSDTPSGPSVGRGFFIGTTAFYVSGDTVPGAPAPLSANSVDFDTRASANGTNNLAVLDIDTSSADDGLVAINGTALTLGGTLVQESLPIPVSVGGLGENWDNFDFVGITESGDYAFSGDTDGPTTADEFIVRNGVIVHREGDMLDGETLTGSIELLQLNENNQLAFVWDILDPVGGGSVEALFFEGQLVLAEGDEVDWDGDGNLDAGFVVDSIGGLESLALTPNGTIYVTADIDTNGGGNLEALLEIGNPGFGINYCMANPNSTGLIGVMSVAGSPVAADNDITLTASNLPVGQFGIFVTSLTQDFMPNIGEGNLCLGGQIGRYQLATQIQQVAPDGTFSLQIDTTFVPQGPGGVAIASGEVWNFQGWHRDFVGGAPTSNFTDGLAIAFQ